MRYTAMFFVTDFSGKQISDEILGEINDFTNYRAARFACIKFSKKNPGQYKVDVCIPGNIFENGKEFTEI